MSIADRALSRIKQLGLSADPASFELWYAYETGEHPTLNQKINAILEAQGELSPQELKAIYDEFFSLSSPEARIEAASTKISDEVDQIVSMIEAAIGSSVNHGGEFAEAQQTLRRSVDHDTLRLIVESLVHSTKEVEQENSSLGASLRQSRYHIDMLRSNLNLAQNESLTDSLTELPNRRAFEQLFRNAMVESRRDNSPLSLVLCDVDRFKLYNDTYGHQTGDYVLRLVGSEMKRTLKGQDIVARYGGEEFAVVLPNTPLLSAVTVAEILRRAVAEKKVLKRSTGETLGRVTISLGVAELHPHDTAATFIDRADACLYEAKCQGRNRVVDEHTHAAAQPGYQRLNVR